MTTKTHTIEKIKALREDFNFIISKYKNELKRKDVDDVDIDLMINTLDELVILEADLVKILNEGK